MADKIRRDRKFKAFLIVFFVASAMLAFDKLASSEWATVVMAVYAAYMAGNVGEHWTKRGGENGTD